RGLGGGAALSSLLLLLGALAASDRLLARPAEPVPLFPDAIEPPLSGWIVTREPSGLYAIDLASGRRQPIVERDPSNPDLAQAYLQSALSPSATLVAVWGQNPGGPVLLRVARLDGTRLLERAWPAGSDTIRWVTGWLGDDTVLVVETPQMRPNESQEAYAARARQETRLIALDVRDGRERVLLAGASGVPVPSPDGRLMALARDDGAPYPGATLEIRPLAQDGLGPPIATAARRSIGDVVWAPDGSRVYFVQISDDPLRPLPADWQFGPGSYPVDRADLAALDLQGRLTPLTRVAPGQSVSLLGVSPDGRQVVYRLSSQQEERAPGATRPPASADEV
ncbi:MAG: hypothetical protein IRY97_12635, partial [Thermomicrobiaceae bacterium]|nr:hypothetical protein [Thermomicrobiaceae bacterium]